MAKSLNSISFTGYLGQDPRHHVFDNGDEVCNLSVAIGRQKKQDGEYVDDTIWVDVKVFGKGASACANYLTTGSFVAVNGQLAQPRTWQDNEGAARFTIVVDHATVTFGPRTDGGNGNGNGGQQQQSQPRQQAAAKPAAAQASRFGDDDVPF